MLGKPKLAKYPTVPAIVKTEIFSHPWASKMTPKWMRNKLSPKVEANEFDVVFDIDFSISVLTKGKDNVIKYFINSIKI